MVIENNYAPFLKGHWILPGQVERLKKAPAEFDFRGSVTHHDIFVRIKKANASSGAKKSPAASQWIALDELKKKLPASLVRKAIEKGCDL